MNFLQRLQLAWKILTRKPFRLEVELQPYHYYCKLRTDIGRTDCDNIRRKSKCKNGGKIALARTTLEVKIDEGDYYHVCEQCAAKYIGTNGEDF
jgi:hypothetical protein